MASSIMSKVVSTKECLFQFLYMNDNKPEMLQNIIKSYIRGEKSKIEDLIKYVENNDAPFFAICNLIENDEKLIGNLTEHWICFVIVKHSTGFSLFLKDSLESREYEAKKHDLKELIKKTLNRNSEFNFIEHGDRESSMISGGSDISTALVNMKVLIDLSNNKEKTFEELFQEQNFYILHEQSIEFDRLIAETGLSDDCPFYLKPALQKILSALQRIIEKKSDYTLNKDQLNKLIQTIDKLNFLPRGNDKIDLREIVIGLVTVFKQRGLILDDKTLEMLKTYFIKNKQRYLDKISELDNKLREDSRDIQVQDYLGLALIDQLMFLIYMGKLTPELLTFGEFDQFLQLLGASDQEKALECETRDLENQLKTVQEQDKIRDLSYEMSDCRQRMEYFVQRSGITQSINLDEFIVVFGNIVKTLPSDPARNLSLRAMEKLLAIGKTTANKEISLAILELLNCLEFSKYVELEDDLERTFDNILPKISLDNGKLIVSMSKKIVLNKSPSFLKLFHRILIESEDKQTRDEVRKRLQSSKIDSNESNYVGNLVKLEESCLKNGRNILSELSVQIENQHPLTFNCFEQLTKYFSHETTSSILDTIVEYNIQKIPKSFVTRFNEYVESSSNVTKNLPNIVRMSKSLIKGQYIEIAQVQRILEQMLNNETLNDDVFDIVFIELKNEHVIPPSIVDKLRSFENSYEKVANLIKLIDKKCNFIDILKCSGYSLAERMKALEGIVNDSRNHVWKTVETLEQLIKYDLELRTDSFKALVKIMPINYTKKNFPINLAEIAACIGDDPTISADDLLILIRKDMNADLSHVLPLIFLRICTDEKQLLSFVDEISHSLQGSQFIFSQIESLIQLAIYSTDIEFRKKLIENINMSMKNQDLEKIIGIQQSTVDKSLYGSLVEELKKLEEDEKLVINQDTLEKLKKTHKEGYFIVDSHIERLIVALGDVIYKNLYELISDVLLTIYREQGFNETANNTILKQIENNLNLLRYANVVEIIAVSAARNLDIPNAIVNGIWEQYSNCENNVNLKYNLVLATRALIFQHKRIPHSVMTIIANLLKMQETNIQIKLTIAEILSIAISNSETFSEELKSVCEILRNVALTPMKNLDEDRLNGISMRAIKRSIEENSSSHDFLSKHYTVFKERLVSLAKYSNEELQPLDDYMKDVSNALEKFHLLVALNNTLLNGRRLDTTIFADFQKTHWIREILSSELLADIFRKNDSTVVVSEIELQQFRDNISLLSMMIEEPNSIEIVLQSLIDKQHRHSLSLEIANGILIMLRHGAKMIDILLSDNDDNFYMEMRETWLCIILECSDEQARVLNQYLPYRIEIINGVFERISEDTSIDELLMFFDDLANCGLRWEAIERFLINNIPYKQDIRVWRVKLVEKLMEALLCKRFPCYHTTCQYEQSKSEAIVNNPYNTADMRYMYSKEDITIISFEWMKEFIGEFSISRAFDVQNSISLLNILSTVAAEYKKDKKPIVAPLCISLNHWIVIALVNHNNRDILLYKDSLGENNDMNQRRNIHFVLSEALGPIDFKFHASRDQTDNCSSGIFTLANMKIMATALKRNRNKFLKTFENTKFTSQADADNNRVSTFPKMYALSLFHSYVESKVIDCHSIEAKSVKQLLQKNSELDNKFEVTITFPEKESLLKADYEYLYAIQARENVSFSNDSEMKKAVCSALHITSRKIYSEKRNKLEILPANIKDIVEKQKKLNLNQLRAKFIENDTDDLLSQLNVACIESNRQKLIESLEINDNIAKPSKRHELEDETCLQLVKDLHKKLVKIAVCGWNLKSFEQLLKCIDSRDKLEFLIKSIDPIYEYELKEYDVNIEGKNLIDIIKLKPCEIWVKEIYDLAISQTFKGSYDRDLENLKADLYRLNQDNQISYLCDDKLIADYRKINEAYQNKSKLFDSCRPIQFWTADDIKTWALQVKLTPSNVSLHEKLAVIKRAVEIHSKFPPREIQLLSVLIMINPEKSRGLLAQINTGEGKTTIVAMLAAIKALEGHTVDVVTSSPELAKPQAEQQNGFFQLFHLTVSHNTKDSQDIKERYRADIVYGAASDFQGDILRDEYSKIGTRSGRKCDVAIVDEVDSMLIDGKNHIVMLSTPMPAMDYLEPLLATIWVQIEETAKHIEVSNGKAYYIEQSEMLDENGKLKTDVANHAYPIEGSKEDFIKNSTEKYIRKLIRDIENLPEDERDIPKDYPIIHIPPHLRELVIKSQLPKWIDSAIYAKYKCQHEKNYIIKDRKIAPVDASNTGIVQQNMHWNNGLHQFLQIKHGAKITAESLTTNFISNVTYFKRYKDNIYGLTGTLGSINARELLKSIYSVDCVIIPPFRQKQYKELTPIITDNENAWYNNIVDSCTRNLKHGRGVLIITKYIKEVDKIKDSLITSGYDREKIKVYKTEEESSAIKDELKPGEVIIATNIAGRGTDIKADKIENNGGLHVCVTFLPPNERVEQQNVGRTSRTGNKGTSQFVLFEKYSQDYNTLKRKRDQIEESELQRARTKIEAVTIKDEVFAKFCELLNKIDNKDDFANSFKVRAVEERFGIWLKMQECSEQNTNEINILTNFEDFEKEILDDKQRDQLIKNPHFHVLIGNELLTNRKFMEAIKEFSKAISLDEFHQVNAFYNRGYARVAAYGGSVKKEKEQIEEAVNDFKKAREIIEENLEPMLYVIQRASSSEALSEQVSNKMTLFGIQKNTIEMAIGSNYDEQIKVIKAQREQQGIEPSQKEALDKNIKDLEERKQKIGNGIIHDALSKRRDLKIELLGIEKCLPEDQNIDLYKEEIDEYKNNGFQSSFQVTEVKPIKWWSVIGVTALGLAQMIGGAAIAVFSLGAGSSFGMGLLCEGVSDLITAVKSGIINRDFSWAAYGIQKAISITVSVVCAGLGAIKDAAKTVVAGVKQIGTVAVTAVNQTLKAGMSIAAKAMGTELGKGVAKHMITQLIDYGVSKTLMPSIQEQVMQRVETPIQNALLNNQKVMDMLKLDGINRNSYYQSLIKRKAMEILNPQGNPEHPLSTISKGIAAGIAKNKISGLSTILQISDAVLVLDELANFVEVFNKNLEKEIELIYTGEAVDKKLEGIDIEQQNASTQSQANNKQNEIKSEKSNSYSTMDYAAEQQDNDIDLSLNQNNEEQVKLDRENMSPTTIGQSLASSVSVNMCNIIQGKLITPITNAGINYGMRQVTAGLDESLQKQIGDYQAERRIEFFQDRDKSNRIPDEFKQGMKNEEAMRKADAMIDELQNGGEAGLAHLGPLSDQTGRPIKVLDEQGRVIRIIGEDKGGEPILVEYHKSMDGQSPGHWTLPGNKEPTSNDTGKNNCLFNVISEQTGDDPKKLRENTVEQMKNNKENLANQASDIQRLEQYKKDALTLGGARLLSSGKVKLDKEDVDYLCENIDGITEKRKDPPSELAAIRACDDKGETVETKRHHMIPESSIREHFREFIKENSAPEDRPALQQKLDDYLNNSNNALGREIFINKLGLRTSPNNQSSDESFVANTYTTAVSWHPNNLRIGPGDRTDDPTRPGSTTTYDYPIADEASTRVMREFEEGRSNDILRSLNKLPNNPRQYAWKKLRHGLYEVDRTQKIKPLPSYLKQNVRNAVSFNICASGGRRIFKSKK